MNSNNNSKPPVNFNIDPNRTPLLLIDSYMIGSNENLVILNFAQAVLDGKQQNIVARLALLPKQAKEFIRNLNDHLEKFEV